MVAPRSNCNPQSLQLLLEDHLSEREQAPVLQHLEGCESCRLELESLAADDSWWEEASQFLTEEPDDDCGFSSVSVECAALRRTSFPVDMLEKCDDPRLLGLWDGYDVLEVIGAGGMGVVLKGFQRDLNRCVAIKVLAPQFAGSAAARRRFAREAQAAAAVVHPHVVAIHAVADHAKLPYLVMQYVAGESLQARIDERGPLETRDVLRIALQAARGLAAAHAQGLVHRDVKPANILLEAGVDRAMLTDFGLARAVDETGLTLSGGISGTPQYMSPEQARGDAADHRSDLFSLGSVMYAMCAGQSPFRAETTYGVLRRTCECHPHKLRELNPDVPAWLASIIDRLLSKSPADRIQTAGEVADLLERCLAHLQQPTQVALPRLPWRIPRGRRAWFGVGALTASVAIITGAVWFAWRPTGVTHSNIPPVVPVGSPTMPWQDELQDDLSDLERQMRRLEAAINE